MSTPRDPVGKTKSSGNKPQGTDPELEKPDIGGRGPTEAFRGHAADGPSPNHEGHRDDELKALYGIDPMAYLVAYILSSRERTLNAVLILLATGVCIAFVSRSISGIIIGLTSVGTVVVVFTAGAVKVRRKRRENTEAGSGDTRHTSGNDRSG